MLLPLMRENLTSTANPAVRRADIRCVQLQVACGHVYSCYMNSTFKKKMASGLRVAYLLVGVGAPEDMSIVSFMLLPTGFG